MGGCCGSSPQNVLHVAFKAGRISAQTAAVAQEGPLARCDRAEPGMIEVSSLQKRGQDCTC